MNHWAAKYIGIPYRLGGRESDGLDCYGLLRVIYWDERRILLPDLLGVAEAGILPISHEILARSQDQWIELSKPVDGCAVAMSQREVLHHVGVWTDVDGGKVIHAHPSFKTVVAETLQLLRWKGFRVIRFFDYVSIRTRDNSRVALII